MSRPLRIALGTLAVLALAVLIIPLVWPIPPLEDTVPVEELAGDEARFAEVDGVRIHYVESGSASAERTFILMHGFGASTFSWRDQLELLRDRGRVVAFDRPAFGFTERLMPPYRGANPYSIEANADQLVGLMDELGIEKAVVVGHSAGGAAAVYAAARYPERIEALVLEAPAVYEARATPSLLSALLRSPQARRVGPLFARRIAGAQSDEFVRSAYADPDFATPEVLAGYRKPLSAENWDRGLWELIAAPRPRSAADVLQDVVAPTLVIAGDSDTFVEPANSEKVARTIERAQKDAGHATPGYPEGSTYVEFEDTGHLPHEERPEQFANEVFRFVDTLPVECDV